MIPISAQISLYPLGQEDIATPIQEVIAVFAEHGLSHRVGSMSTLVWGDDEALFAALREAFARATGHGGAVMVITVSNACPLPPSEELP